MEAVRPYPSFRKLQPAGGQYAARETQAGIAATAHIPVKELAKTVMVKINGDMAMAVLSADDSSEFL